METSLFQATKLYLVTTTGLSRDALHICVGLALFLVAAVIFRKSLRSFLPVLIVMAVAILGELLDMRDDFRVFGYWDWQNSLGDFINSVFWPLAICLMARTGLLGGRQA